MSVDDYMRSNDVKAFHDAAGHFRVWILVRASNPAGKQYIGVPGYVPKRLDCKAKTADFDVTLPGGLGRKKTAGLVVSLAVPGMLSAFQDQSDVKESWLKFQHLCYFPEPGVTLSWFPNGKLYSVQMDPSHERYGCMTFSSSSNRANAAYIHSDYDLYGIVPEDNPAENIRVTGKRLGQDHARSQIFFDVQHYLNHRMGVPMILHGEQETFTDDMDDNLDVFCPDGTSMIQAYGAGAILQLYETTFKGRQMYGEDSNPKPYFGMWQVLGPK
jgi:hypothetical protein